MRLVLLGTQSAALNVKTIFKCLYFSPQTILGVPSIICPATTGATLLLLGSVCVMGGKAHRSNYSLEQPPFPLPTI